MQMKWKKTGAALLVATLTVTGSGYAWANENLFDTVDLNKVIKTTEDSKSDVVNPEVTIGDTVGIDIEIPEGYTAGNLEALSKAYDNAGNETAKAAIKRNAERAIEKFEASQKVEPEAPESEEPKVEEPKVEQPVVEAPKTEAPKVEQPKVEEPTKEEPTKEVPAKKVEKEERKALQAEQKAERKALKEAYKEERKALQAEHKAEKQENKKNKKDED